VGDAEPLATAAEQPPQASIPAEERIIEAFRQRFAGKVLSTAILRRGRVKVTVDPSIIREAAQFLKELGFDHIHVVTGTDYPQERRIEVTYIVGSVEAYRSLVVLLATNLPRDRPRMPTLIPIWPGAEYHEREEYEMLGIEFEGHPKLARLLLPEDWNDIPPLRRDFKLRKWHEWERAEHGLVKPREPEAQPAAVKAAPTPAAPRVEAPKAAEPRPGLPQGLDAGALEGIIKLLDLKGRVELGQLASIIKLRTKQERPDVEPYIRYLEQQGRARREGDAIVKV
jgi:NADH-quinone oxidoreductase subunit C